MAWAYVSAGSGSNNTGAALTLTFQTTGDAVFGIVITNRSSAGAITVSDNKSGTWTTDLTVLDATNGASLAICSAPNHPNGGVSTVFTPATAQAGGAILAFAILEYSGIATASPKDVGVGTSNFGTAPSTGNSGATGAANELVLGAAYSDGGAQTFGAGSGETSRQNPAVGFMIEDKDSGSSGTTPASIWTSNQGSVFWIVGEVIYKIAAGGAAFSHWAEPLRPVSTTFENIVIFG